MDKQFILCVDFDGTCVEYDFPKVGKDVPHAADVLKWWTSLGHHIILWTMRDGERTGIYKNILADAVKWFEDKKIPLLGINKNPTQSAWSSSPKAYAHWYVDDAAIGCPLIHLPDKEPYVNWITIKMILEKEIYGTVDKGV